MNQNIKTISGIIIVLILIVTVGVFAWQFGKKSAIVPAQPIQTQTQDQPQRSQPQTTQQKGETADSQTYRNEKYGYEFKYEKGNLILLDAWHDGSATISGDSGLIEKEQIIDHWAYGVGVTANEPLATLEEIANQSIKKLANAMEVPPKKENIILSDVSIDGRKAKKVVVKNWGDYGNARVVLVVGNNIITIAGDAADSENEGSFDAFIQTFKFWDAPCTFTACQKNQVTDTTDWKTKYSEKLGINFKYPPSYIILDLLNYEEKAILIGDKEFPRSEIAPWFHAPITIAEYNESNFDAQVASLSGVQKNLFMNIGGHSAIVVEGKYSDYPSPGMPAINNSIIIALPGQNIIISSVDNYAGTKSDWKEISSVLKSLLTTLTFPNPLR